MKRTRRVRRRAGFSLLELMVTMGLATLLISMGAGVYVKMGRRSAATQAIGSVNGLLVRAKNASTRFPATVAADANEGLVHAYTDEVVQELHFEPRRIDGGGEYTPLGIQGRECVLRGGATLDADQGRVGAGLRMDGGALDCGNYAAYDMDQGLNVEMWIRPSDTPRGELITRGQTLRIRLDAVANRSARLGVRLQVQDPSGSQEGVEQIAEVPTVRIQEWLGIRVSYDRTELVISTNDGYGFVVRSRFKETRRLAVDRDASLVVANGFRGWIDDVRVGGIRSAEPLRLPIGVTLTADNPPIRFVDGRLDPAVHSGPARMSFVSAGKISTFVVGTDGNLLTVEQTDAPPEPAAPGADPK